MRINISRSLMRKGEFVDEGRKKLVSDIANIPDEKFEELIENVVKVATKYNHSFESHKDELKCGIQISPDKFSDSLLHIYGAGYVFSFEVIAFLNKIDFVVYATPPGGNLVAKNFESEEMQQLISTFFRENIDDYEKLLGEEVSAGI